MTTRLILGGLTGMAIGAITGWTAFGNLGSGFGIGISMACAICGVLIAYGYEQQK